MKSFDNIVNLECLEQRVIFLAYLGRSPFSLVQVMSGSGVPRALHPSVVGVPKGAVLKFSGILSTGRAANKNRMLIR